MTPRPMGTQSFEQSEEKKELVQLSVSNGSVVTDSIMESGQKPPLLSSGRVVLGLRVLIKPSRTVSQSHA